MPTTSILAQRLYADREKTGDVTFIVESETIYAHRIVLAAISPKYDAQFYGCQPDEGDIHVSDISADAFKEFIKFLYLEDATLTLENIAEILNLAKQCLVDHFVTKCGIFLINCVNASNLCWVYRLAILYDLKAVRDLCEHKIGPLVPEMFTSDDFLRCDRDILFHILQVESIDCNEMDIFQGCISWAKIACQQKKLDDGKPENLRAELGQAVRQIRFASMTIKEFATLNKSLEGFFSPDEFMEITNIIAGLDNFKSQNFIQAPRAGQVSRDFAANRNLRFMVQQQQHQQQQQQYQQQQQQHQQQQQIQQSKWSFSMTH